MCNLEQDAFFYLVNILNNKEYEYKLVNILNNHIIFE